MVGFCADPAGSLSWLHVITGAPCLRGLANVLREKSVFGHWVPPGQYGTAGRPKRNAK
jgi:hypothetical protein